MKINFGLNAKEWRKSQPHWQEWFAWYPVKVGAGDWRWIEKVKRTRYVEENRLFDRKTYYYRAIE